MRKNKRKKRKKHFRLLSGGIIFLGVMLFLNSCVLNNHSKLTKQETEEVTLSTAVKAKTPLLESYAIEHGVEDYTNYLLAIMQVESAGLHTDVMQSSESLDLPPGSLTTEESISQGCRYFAKLLGLANEKNCDFNTVIQAYNFGDGFIDYVAENGGVYSFELAQTYAAEKADGAKITYLNAAALKENGGWRYQYGNMFYVQLVSQYL